MHLFVFITPNIYTFNKFCFFKCIKCFNFFTYASKRYRYCILFKLSKDTNKILHHIFSTGLIPRISNPCFNTLAVASHKTSRSIWIFVSPKKIKFINLLFTSLEYCLVLLKSYQILHLFLYNNKNRKTRKSLLRYHTIIRKWDGE